MPLLQKDFLKAAQKGAEIPTGDAYILQITPFERHVLEMEDVHFRSDSAVFMPDPRCTDDPKIAAEDRITGLAVLAACYKHAKAHPSHKLLVTGHTDTTGKPTYNLALSTLRAQNVFCALTGDRNGWIETALAKHIVADYQHILRWTTLSFGWDCDPGEVDNELGPKTRAAVRQFQGRYNQEYKKSISVNGLVGKETWGAFFDLYLQELELLLDTDDAGLSGYRSALKPFGPGYAGCGPMHPIEAAHQDDYRSKTNRRVEVIFFAPGNEPSLHCHPDRRTCIGESCPIYDDVCYNTKYLPCDEVAPARRTLKVYLLDSARKRMPHAPYRLRVRADVREGQADSAGLVSIDDLLIPGPCFLEWGPKSPYDPGVFPYKSDLKLGLVEGDPPDLDAQAQKRLHNLGYRGPMEEMITAFQAEYGLQLNPWPDPATKDALFKVHHEGEEAPDLPALVADEPYIEPIPIDDFDEE